MEPLRLKMAAQRAASERQITAGGDRVASASATLRGAVLSARSGSHQTLSNQEELTGLKGRLRELEADLARALSIKLAKESKCELTRKSVSSTAATNEQLKNLVTDHRNRRDQHAAVISNELEALEALEARNSRDETWRKDLQKAVSWYHEFLGFQVVVGGEVLRCDPPMKDSEELVNDLKLTDDLFKFVRIIRQRFQAASVNGILPVSPVVHPDASSIPVSSPVVMSVDSKSGNAIDQSHSRSENNKRALPTKRRAATLSAACPSALRRSPRLSAASPGVVCHSPSISVTVSSSLDIFPFDYLPEEHVSWSPQILISSRYISS